MVEGSSKSACARLDLASDPTFSGNLTIEVTGVAKSNTAVAFLIVVDVTVYGDKSNVR